LHVSAVIQTLINLGARQWQADIVGPLIAAALLERKALVIATDEAKETAEN
jgi:hypothetical protein